MSEVRLGMACLELLQVILEDIKITGPSTIEADWVSAGWLKKELFPWQPKVPPFKGTCQPYAKHPCCH